MLLLEGAFTLSTGAFGLNFKPLIYVFEPREAYEAEEQEVFT